MRGFFIHQINIRKLSTWGNIASVNFFLLHNILAHFTPKNVTDFVVGTFYIFTQASD